MELEFTELVDSPEVIFPEERRCNALAAVVFRDIMESNEGPVEFMRARCVDGHSRYFPVEMLERDLSKPRPAVIE